MDIRPGSRKFPLQLCRVCGETGTRAADNSAPCGESGWGLCWGHQRPEPVCPRRPEGVGGAQPSSGPRGRHPHHSRWHAGSGTSHGWARAGPTGSLRGRSRGCGNSSALPHVCTFTSQEKSTTAVTQKRNKGSKHTRRGRHRPPAPTYQVLASGSPCETQNQGMTSAAQHGACKAGPAWPQQVTRTRWDAGGPDTELPLQTWAHFSPTHPGTCWWHVGPQIQEFRPPSTLTKQLQRHLSARCPYFIH